MKERSRERVTRAYEKFRNWQIEFAARIVTAVVSSGGRWHEWGGGSRIQVISSGGRWHEGDEAQGHFQEWRGWQCLFRWPGGDHTCVYTDKIHKTVIRVCAFYCTKITPQFLGSALV